MQKRHLLPVLLMLCCAAAAGAEERILAGNVYGTVTDAETGAPVGGAHVYLLGAKDCAPAGARMRVRTGQGEFILPHYKQAVRQGLTDGQGAFLINAVPVPYPFFSCTVYVTAPGYGAFVVHDVRVFPGASMALSVACRLRKGSAYDTWFEGASKKAPVSYRHGQEEASSEKFPSAAPAPESTGVSYTIFATREGLVGGTTANGHVITENDHFVALPSVRVLNADDSDTTFMVRLTAGDKSIDAPVWDVGPWNIHDDYWNEPEVREQWIDLPQGTPESQAAYEDGYNGGLDGFYRTVQNPAGIDLADGVFWDDLELSDNAWITVDYRWRPGVAAGSRVQATVELNVRSGPGGALLGTADSGDGGTVTAGPQGADFGGVFFVWWEIDWDSGLAGWSAENWLEKESGAEPPATSTTTTALPATTTVMTTTTTATVQSTTTTSSSPDTSTTSSLPGDTATVCPLAQILDEETTSLLRHIRDRRLLATGAGVLVAVAYYQTVAEVGSLLASRPGLRLRVLHVIRDNRAVLEELAAPGACTVPRESVAAASGLLRELEEAGGPGLSPYLRPLRDALEQGTLIPALGLAVEE